MAKNIDEKFAEGKGAYQDPEAKLAAAEQAGGAPAMEEQPDSDNISNAEQAAGNWVTNVTAPANQPQKVTGKGRFRRGPTFTIVGIIVFVLTGGAVVLTPSMLPMYAENIFSTSLDDITSGLQSRYVHVVKTRIQGMTSGICGEKVSVRCRFSTAGHRQITALERAGIKVDCGDGYGTCDKRFRNRIQGLQFPDGTEVRDPAKVWSSVRGNPAVLRDLYKSFNVKWYSLNTPSASKALKERGLNKTKKIKGSTKEELDESLNKAVNAEAPPKINGVDAKPVLDDDGNETGKYSITNADGTVTEYDQAELDKQNSSLEKAKTEVNASKGLAGAVKGIGIIGTADSACSIYQATRMLSLSAKVIRNERLMQFAMAMLGVSSSIKAGQAKPEEVSYAATKWTETDPRETIGIDGVGQPIANPNYGKSATDSSMWKLAALGEVPKKSSLSTSMSSFMVGGTGAGMLNSVYQTAKSLLGGNTQACGIVQNPLVRAGSAIVGFAVGLTPIGLAGTVIKAVAGTIATDLAMGYLESMIMEQAEDVDINELARYTDMSAAMYTGTSGVYGAVASATGATPTTAANLTDYMQTREDGQAQIAKAESQLAAATPFDVSNPYSFVGTLIRNTASIVGSGSFVDRFLGMIPRSFASALTGNTVNAAALAEQFNICEDEDYEDLGIKADVMCNLRYGFSSDELAMDTGEVADWMVNNGYVKDDAEEDAPVEDVAVKDSLYAKYLDNCAFRTTPYGEQGTEEDNGDDRDWVIGKNCLGTGADLSQSVLSYFKVFTADYNIILTLDGGSAA
ncbi:hypothetical protein [Microbacterium sp. NPDC076895]|uniref:hypothetical protein n=1 Tax=Microbacterium sp. NPDC076895 TaxID=3154957 RepID=UPI0034497B60